MKILSVENLEKSFGDLQVLKDISMEVNHGEIVSIIGSSGSGKSTLLRCINRLETIDSGKITVDGEVMVSTHNGKVEYASNDVLNEIRLKTGLVFQNFNLFPHFNVLKNITQAPIRVKKIPKDIASSIKKEFGINVDSKKIIAEFCNEYEEKIIKRIGK